MRISVIIPVYNCKDVVPKCLDSVIEQTYENIEIICIDDGSTDGTGNILEEYALKDSRIKVFHYENGGIATARNRGLSKAQGEYVYFMDSDDYIEKELLEKIVNIILSEDVDVCMFNLSRHFGNKVKGLRVYDGETGELKEKDSVDTFAKYYKWAVVWNKVIKRSVIEENEIEFIDLFYLDDYLFCIDIYKVAKKIFYYDYYGYHYVEYSKSVTHSKEKKQIVMWEQFYTQAKEDSPISDKEAYLSFLNSFIFNGLCQIYERYIKHLGKWWEMQKKYRTYKTLVEGYPYNEALHNYKKSYLSLSSKLFLITGKMSYIRLMLLDVLKNIRKCF